jgi:hypothetical protein
MTIHEHRDHKVPDNPWAELALVTALVVIFIILASKYVW